MTKSDQPAGGLASIEGLGAGPEARKTMQDESGWLIEMKFGDGLLWWSGEFDDHRTSAPWWIRPTASPDRLTARMVNDAGHAVRFARREDAQRVLDGMLSARPSPLLYAASELYSVQEHLWPAPDSETHNAELRRGR